MNHFSVIGESISYSLSPLIHENIFAVKGQHLSFQVDQFPSSDFTENLSRLRRIYDGFTVTIPYKLQIMPYVSCDKASATIGAVNVVRNVEGELYGYNTDHLGISYDLNRLGFQCSGKNILILGGGGAALAAIYALKQMGANIFVSNRNALKNAELSAKTGVLPFTNQDIYGVINATPVGTVNNNDSFHIDLNELRCLHWGYDMVYNPPVTKLMAHCIAKNIPCENGLGMLVAQAVFANQIWTGSLFSGDDILQVLKKTKADLAVKKLGKKNILLCGFMAAGKTTLGAALASCLSLPHIDTDNVIEKQLGMPVAEIFNTQGEGVFRSCEVALAKEIKARKSTIFSLGGGFIFNPCVLDTVSDSILIFIDTPLPVIKARLLGDSTRPLAIENVDILYNSRYHMYKKSADRVFIPSGTVLNDVDSLLKLL